MDKNIVINLEYTLCHTVQGHLKNITPYDQLVSWLNFMHDSGFKIWIVSEYFYDIRSNETMERVKWLNDNNINYDMLVTHLNLPIDYWYFVRRFKYTDLFIINRKTNVPMKFTGIDFNLPL